MKILHMAFLGASTLLLAGCGGGGGGSAATSLNSSVNLASGSGLDISQRGAVTSSNVTVSQNGETLTYNTTTLSKTGTTQDPDTGANITRYSAKSGNTTTAEAFLIDGGSNAAALKDTKLGVIVTGTNPLDDNGTADKFGTFHTGNKTAADDMPNNVTATYNGGFVGFEKNNVTGNITALTGQSSLTADFGANTVSGNISNIKAGVDSRSYGVSINGTISGTGYSGTANLTGPGSNGSSGTVGGQFYGAGAAETAGNVNVTGNSNSVNVAGTFAGAK